MAELTNLEEKLGEVIGLAQAAKAATDKIIKLDEAESVKDVLERMNEEAAETEKRGTDVADGIEGKKTAILEKASETKSKASDMLKTYIDEESDALDGFEFLTMAEAGEVGHWKVLRVMAEAAGDQKIKGLTDWALPIQERHFEDAQGNSLKLAGEQDPNETS
jgi:hypothetical protein